MNRVSTRRAFVVHAGLGAVALMTGCSSPAVSPSLPKARTIGYLSAGSAQETSQGEPQFRQKLRELGYLEGRDVTIELRKADNVNDRLPALVSELLGLNADVLVTQGTPATLAAKQATATTPIVFFRVNNPATQGIVASEARPGGNVTGVIGPQGPFGVKQLEFLEAMLPRLKRIALLANVNNPSAVEQIQNFSGAARARGLELQPFPASSTNAVDTALDDIVRWRPDALVVGLGFTLARDLRQIPDFVADARLPAIYSTDPDFVRNGGLMAFGSNSPAQARKAAEFVDKILKGVRPADLPVEHTTELDFVVNLSAAERIGLQMPPAVLTLATEVIR